jgi:branched-chain amino acid transport system substrate-binding protein
VSSFGGVRVKRTGERMSRRRWIRWSALIGAASCVAAVALPGVATASSKAPITIGFITSETGVASSSYVGSQWGAEARIDAQNAAGGVDGHKLVLDIKDDTSSPTTNQTVAQELAGDGVFGVIEDTSFTYGGYHYLQQAGIPVTGAAIDGPEWGEVPNDNMFSVSVPVSTPIGGKFYTYNDEAKFLKMVGVHKVAGLAFDIQSAIQANSSTFQTAEKLGISICYQNNTIAFGATDMTAEVLAMKQNGCDGVAAATLLSTDVALASAINNAGLSSKVKQLYYTAYDQNLLDSAASVQAMQGTYSTTTVDFTKPNAAAKLMLSRLKQYTAFPGGIPSLNIIYGYAAADLMIKGLELTGGSTNRQTFITDLHKVGSYSAEGLFPSSVTFQHFGTVNEFPKTACAVIVEVKGKGYVDFDGGKPICGTRVATNAASSA